MVVVVRLVLRISLSLMMLLRLSSLLCGSCGSGLLLGRLGWGRSRSRSVMMRLSCFGLVLLRFVSGFLLLSSFFAVMLLSRFGFLLDVHDFMRDMYYFLLVLNRLNACELIKIRIM